MADPVLTEDDAGVRCLTLNRPEALNAFNQELWYALTECLDRAASDDGVRCVLLTGSGRAFSAGQDLAEMADPSVFEGAEPGYERLMPTLEAYFHYRNLDVSSLKELARRWAPEIYAGFSKDSSHLALDDIRDSIAELRYYRQHLLKI